MRLELWNKWNRIRRAHGIARVRRRRAKAIAGLEPVNPRRFEWTDLDTVTTNGTAVQRRRKLSPIQSERTVAGEWAPFRELGTRGWA